MLEGGGLFVFYSPMCAAQITALEQECSTAETRYNRAMEELQNLQVSCGLIKVEFCDFSEGTGGGTRGGEGTGGGTRGGEGTGGGTRGGEGTGGGTRGGEGTGGGTRGGEGTGGGTRGGEGTGGTWGEERMGGG